MLSDSLVGTLVFSGYVHIGATQVYIITQNSNWNQVESSDKYLSSFQNPSSWGGDYYGFGVVEQDDNIYLIGGYTGSFQNGLFRSESENYKASKHFE